MPQCCDCGEPATLRDVVIDGLSVRIPICAECFKRRIREALAGEQQEETDA